MKRYIRSSDDSILCMSNLRGRDIVHPKNLPFSFYFGSGSGYQHTIRVKPVFNPDKLQMSQTGVLKLNGDWDYIPGNENHKVSHSEIRIMKEFFRENLVLFCMAWDEQLTDSDVADYLRGDITLQEMIHTIDFYPLYKEQLDKISSVRDLEDFCRSKYLVNFYGN